MSPLLLDALLALDYEPFSGRQVLDNTVRLFIIIVGFFFSMLAWKIGVKHYRAGEHRDGLRHLGGGFLLLSPPLSGVLRFGNSLQWETATAYVVGLALLLVTYLPLTFRPPWQRVRPAEEEVEH